MDESGKHLTSIFRIGISIGTKDKHAVQPEKAGGPSQGEHG